LIDNLAKKKLFSWVIANAGATVAMYFLCVNLICPLCRE